MLQKLQFQVNIFLWSIVAYLLSVAFTLAPLLIISIPVSHPSVPSIKEHGKNSPFALKYDENGFWFA